MKTSPFNQLHRLVTMLRTKELSILKLESDVLSSELQLAQSRLGLVRAPAMERVIGSVEKMREEQIKKNRIQSLIQELAQRVIEGK